MVHRKNMRLPYVCGPPFTSSLTASMRQLLQALTVTLSHPVFQMSAGEAITAAAAILLCKQIDIERALESETDETR